MLGKYHKLYDACFLPHPFPFILLFPAEAWAFCLLLRNTLSYTPEDKAVEA